MLHRVHSLVGGDLWDSEEVEAYLINQGEGPNTVVIHTLSGILSNTKRIGAGANERFQYAINESN
jgi:hypothetical protein